MKNADEKIYHPDINPFSELTPPPLVSGLKKHKPGFKKT